MSSLPQQRNRDHKCNTSTSSHPDEHTTRHPLQKPLHRRYPILTPHRRRHIHRHSLTPEQIYSGEIEYSHRFSPTVTGLITGYMNYVTSLIELDNVPDKNGVYRVGGDITPPRRFGNAAYPPDALAAGVDGTVVAEILVNEAGIVSDARVLKSVPPLDDAALKAVIEADAITQRMKRAGLKEPTSQEKMVLDRAAELTRRVIAVDDFAPEELSPRWNSH